MSDKPNTQTFRKRNEITKIVIDKSSVVKFEATNVFKTVELLVEKEEDKKQHGVTYDNKTKNSLEIGPK